MLEVITNKGKRVNTLTDLNKSNNYWVSLTSPTKEEIKELKQKFNLHTTTTKDFSTKKLRPNIEQFNHYNLIVTYTLEYKNIEPLIIIYGKNFLITSSHEKLKIIEKIKQDKEELNEIIDKGPEFLLHLILERSIENLFPLIEEKDKELDILENQALKKPNSKVLERIFEIKREFTKVRRIIYPEREIISSLINSTKDKEAQVYFRDAYDNTILLIDLIDDQRERITNILEIHLSVTSNKLNEVMKVLTVIATVLMPATLIASIYGMNFEFMPELTWKYGYFFALGVIIVVMIITLIILKRKKWV